MRAICILIFTLIFSISSASAQQASAAGVARVAESVGVDYAELEKAELSVRELVYAGQLGKRKRDRAVSLSNRASDIKPKLFRIRKRLRALASKILEREFRGESATRKQTAKFFRLFNQSAKLGNRSDTIISKIRNFVANNPIIPTAIFRGNWNTNFGPITFTQNDRNVVTGTYFWSGGGTVRGRVKGNKLIGNYRGDGTSGSFVVVMDSTNSSWAGRYTTSDGSFSEGWSARRR